MLTQYRQLGRYSPFDVIRDSDGTHDVVSLLGELDLAAAPRLADALRWTDQADQADLYVDTAELTFCDCAGLAVLLAAAQRHRANGTRLLVTNPAPILWRIGRILRLEATLGLQPAPERP